MMKGQWVGRYTSSNSGQILADIDDVDGRLYGHVRMIADPFPNLGAYVRFITVDNGLGPFRLELDVRYIDLPTSKHLSVADLGSQYPGMAFPTWVDLTMQQIVDNLVLNWTSNINATGTATIPRANPGGASSVIAKEMSWRQFKDYVLSLPNKGYIYRGQEKSWRLQTKFHRLGRVNLDIFLNKDIKELHRRLSSRTKHYFNLANPDENGSFIHLVQHHGYPTPLLDWSHSPFVAAFFAFNKAPSTEEVGKVRILIFDEKSWKEDFVQVGFLVITGQHFSIMEFVSLENERMLPQQALSTVTNIHDIESYILHKEREKNKIYLQAIDIPASECAAVMTELDMMGITAGTLFPGLDGTCEELARRFFPH